MPPFWVFIDKETGQEIVREMTPEEFAAFPDPQEPIEPPE